MNITVANRALSTAHKGQIKEHATRYSDSLVIIEDLAELMQRAIAVIRQTLSFASQHIAKKGMDGEG